MSDQKWCYNNATSALLGAYCEYDWERPACAAGAIAMIIGVLQGRTLGAEIPDDVQKLPADINSYLRLLRVVRNKGRILLSYDYDFFGMTFWGWIRERRIVSVMHSF